MHVKYSDEAYDMLLTWVADHQLDDVSRSSLVRVAGRRGDGDDDLRDSKKALDYIPWEGAFWFWYKNQPISYRTKQVDVGFHKEEHISLKSLGRSSRMLKTLLAECREKYLNQIKSKTTIFEHRGDRWKKTGAKNIRPLSTVILSEREKKSLVDDVTEFLNPVTRHWYSDLSLPYRRGYLLSGPPGTGKSSLSFSIAGEVGLDIYIVSIPNTSDGGLRNLFDMLPEKCMVLLEDIDAVGMSRSDSESDTSDGVKRSSTDKPSVTLSGLLNTLDGVASQEGRVVMMTTNYVDRLDNALIRPGRIDRKVEFELASKTDIAQLFSFIYGRSKGGDVAVDSPTIKGQAERFAALVPASTFSQAELISYLLKYRDRPDEALQNCQVWVDATLREKTALKRGDSWNHCG